MGTLLKQFMAGVGGGNPWPSYWATLISATVENAAPTHVVLTFPTAQISLGATDFTVAGFTISSASWTGSVLTLTLTDQVLVFDGNLIITFVKTGETATIINNVLDDGNTVSWYDGDDINTMTIAGSSVSSWRDKLTDGNPLTNWIADKPLKTSEGVTTSITTPNWLSGSFTINNPATFYLLARPLSMPANNYLFDAWTAQMMNTTVQGGGNVRVYDGSAWHEAAGAGAVVLNEWFIIRAQRNGTSSIFRVNDSSINCNFAADAGGICIGRNAGWGFGNFEYKSIICRNGIDNAGMDVLIYNYLKKKGNMIDSDIFVHALPSNIYVI